jgi:hypothetical protein
VEAPDRLPSTVAISSGVLPVMLWAVVGGGERLSRDSVPEHASLPTRRAFEAVSGVICAHRLVVNAVELSPLAG